MSNTIDLSAYTLLDGYGLERRQLKGLYSEDELVGLFIEEWIPLYGCYMCSRADYCKFVVPASASNTVEDEQCGAVINALRNFVKVSFPHLQTFTKKQVQNYLDGAYHLTQFLYGAELDIGRTMDKVYISSLRDWAPAFFGRLTRLREHLDNLSASFSQIPSFQSYKGVILVEGESEKAFINQLKLSHLTWFLHLPVDTYGGGKGSRGRSHLRLLLQRYESQGYVVYLQGDADGKFVDTIFSDLFQENRELITKKNTFVFQYDFETAVPKSITYKVLQEMGHIKDISREDFEKATENISKGIFKRIGDIFGVDLESDKVKFAKNVANLINRHSSLLRNEKFLHTELGVFLTFLKQIRW